MATPFATSAQVEASGSTQITDLIAGASAYIRRVAGWHIFPVVSEVVFVDGFGGSTLLLPTGHLVEEPTVKIDGQEVTDFDWTESGVLERFSGWPRRRRGIEVEMEHGYEEVPELQSLVVSLVKTAIARPSGVTSHANGGMSQVFGTPGGVMLMEPELEIVRRFKL